MVSHTDATVFNVIEIEVLPDFDKIVKQFMFRICTEAITLIIGYVFTTYDPLLTDVVHRQCIGGFFGTTGQSHIIIVHFRIVLEHIIQPAGVGQSLHAIKIDCRSTRIEGLLIHDCFILMGIQ
ncbi:hypothetical protein D3C80_867950 [compost metagenome]